MLSTIILANGTPRWTERFLMKPPIDPYVNILWKVKCCWNCDRFVVDKGSCVLTGKYVKLGGFCSSFVPEDATWDSNLVRNIPRPLFPKFSRRERKWVCHEPEDERC